MRRILTSKNKFMDCDFFVGIDPGITTGVCVWCKSQHKIISLTSCPIHAALDLILMYDSEHVHKIFVRVEDARKRYWFGESDKERWQGAGSIKRDCKIWEDFLKEYNIPFELVAPRNNLTRLTQVAFKNITGYDKQCNEHERAAAMLVYGM